MKIPTRNVVNTQIADQRRHQVLEGVQIAKRVDVLRNSLAELERNQKNFIEQSTKELTQATDKLYTKKIVLEREIKEAEEKLAELRKPLDEEWKVLDKKSNELMQFANDLSSKNLDFELNKQKFEEKKEKLSRQEKHNDLIQEQFIRLLDEAKKEKLEADQMLSDAKANRDEIEKELADRLLAVSVKEEKVEFDLQANEQIKKIYEARNKELETKEKEFNAKYKILKSSIKDNEQPERKTRR
jgi:hypothetical protein